MALKGQVVNFTITGEGDSVQTGTASFGGNSVQDNQAWVCMQSINVSYNGNSNDHNRGISKFIPSVVGISGSQVTVKLDCLYADDNPGKHTMTGTASVLVLVEQ